MEKKIKKHWLESYTYPSDFFEAIGNALAVLGNLFMFSSENDINTDFDSGKNYEELNFRDFEGIIKSTRN
jgi:hypothetical protein